MLPVLLPVYHADAKDNPLCYPTPFSLAQESGSPRVNKFISERFSLCPLPRLVEVGSFGIAAWWATLLYVSNGLFNTNTAFSHLAARGPESGWKWVMVVVGLLHLATFIIGKPIHRFIALAGSLGVWTFVATDLAAGAQRSGPIPLNTGVGCYGMIAGLCAVSMYLLALCWIPDAIKQWNEWQSARGKGEPRGAS